MTEERKEIYFLRGLERINSITLKRRNGNVECLRVLLRTPHSLLLTTCMFASIFGKITGVRGSAIIVENNGIGYKVFVTSHTLGTLAGGSEAHLFLYTYVREDTLALYGFLESADLDMFELLISVSGIGPKAALGILSIADAKTIRMAISREDPSILTRVSGVGKKTAERVILELRNKILKLPAIEEEGISIDADALEALTTMGYSASEAREALKNIPKDITDVGERVKYALRGLGT